MADINDYKIMEEQIRSVAEKDADSILKNWEEGLMSTEEALEQFNKVGKETIKSVSRMGNELTKMAVASRKYTESLTKQAMSQQQNSSWLSKTKSWLYSSPSRDHLATQYSARQMAGGIESIMEGRFSSGARQILSTFPKIANFMSGPYYLALQTVVSGLLKFDEALAKSAKNMSMVTGGLGSQYVDNRLKAFGARHRLKESLREIGLQGNIDEILSASSSNYGQAYLKNNLSDVIKTTGYAQRGLGSFGISDQSAQSLISNLRLIEGKGNEGVSAQLKRLTERFTSSKMFSPEQALQQATSLYDQTKHLGTNFEWASRAIKNFEVGLKNGTISLSDFAAVNRSLRGGGISQNAGIAEVVSDYAGRHGMNLPSSFLNSNAVGKGFAVSTREMLGNNQFARAYQGQIQEMIDQMGMSSREERAGALQMILQSRGINISPEMAKSAIKSNGNIDLIGTNVIGSGSFVKQEKEAQQAKEYEKLVREYYKGTASYQELMSRWVGGIYNKLVGNSISTGLSEGASSSSKDVLRNMAAFFNPDTWKYLLESLDSPLMKGVGVYSTSYSSATQMALNDK